MRRPVMYLAGLLMATGASLALAGPASAAVSHDSPRGHHHHGWCNDDRHSNYNNGNHFNGINILSGVVGGGGLL